MAVYETLYIIHPEITPEGLSVLNEKFKGILAKNDAEVVLFEEWGLKKLAYKVKKQGKGHFYLINYDGPPKSIFEFERILRLSDDVLKYMSVLVEKSALVRLKNRIEAKKNAKAGEPIKEVIIEEAIFTAPLEEERFEEVAPDEDDR